MSSHELLPYAAITGYSAMVAITTWLSYRRIMRKYPPTNVGTSPAYSASGLKPPQKPKTVDQR
jgi:hypothetical protein